MASKKRKSNRKLYLIAGIIVIILIILAINLNSDQKKEENKASKQEETEQETKDVRNENRIAKLQQMEERDRMEFYFGMFLDYVENEKYEEAYDLLYEEFKQNYFPTLEDFTKYVQKTFPEMATIKHENIERNGEVYVLWIEIADVLNGGPNDEKKEMNIVIHENDYNDFVMSFSVI